MESLASPSTWTKLKPLSADGTLLQPLTSKIPFGTKANEPLPSDAEHSWYLGFVKPWPLFQRKVIEFHNSQQLQGALDEIKGHPIGPPRESNISGDDGHEWLADYFQREVLEVVDGIYNRLLKTRAMQEAGIPERVSLGKGAGGDGNVENEGFDREEDLWFEVRAKPIDGNEETHLIGYAEYMGGRRSALSWAIREQLKNSWGSLRCVLGERHPTLLQRE